MVREKIWILLQAVNWISLLCFLLSYSLNQIALNVKLIIPTLSAPFWCLCQKLSLSPLYFNKTLLHTHTQNKELDKFASISCSQMGRVFTDGSTLQTDIQIQCNPYQNPDDYFAEFEELILKFAYKFKGSKITKTILKKKNKIWGITLLDFFFFSLCTGSSLL